MKYFLIGFFVLFINLPSFSQNDVTTYYLIRHAEKDRSEKGLKDPHLTEKGKLRAKKWANVLNHVSFDAIYSTNYFRTIETAQPLAENKQLKILPYNPRSLNINAFKEATIGKTVLIVGHSNTTPMLVNKIIGHKKYAQIEDNNNSNLYIILLNNNFTSDTLLTID